ncbi:Ig-like domain-containing protein [Streptococcus suis]
MSKESKELFHKKQRFSIRTFSVGVFSVLIGATFALSSEIVQAQDTTATVPGLSVNTQDDSTSVLADTAGDVATQAPVISGLGTVTVPNNYDGVLLEVTDADSAVTVTLDELPAGFTFESNQLKVTESAAAGTYTIAVRATDDQNNVTEGVIVVTVTDNSNTNTAFTATATNTTGDGKLPINQANTITGTVPAGYTLVYAVTADGTVVEGTLQLDGTYSIALPAELGNGQVVVYAEGPNQTKVSQEFSVEEVTDPIIPAGTTPEANAGTVGMTAKIPVVNYVTESATSISGNADPGATITITDKDNMTLGQAVANVDGSWTVGLLRTLKELETLTVAAYVSGYDVKKAQIIVGRDEVLQGSQRTSYTIVKDNLKYSGLKQTTTGQYYLDFELNPYQWINAYDIANNQALMYYELDPKLAEHVVSVETLTDNGLGGQWSNTTDKKNTTEIPNADNVWSSGYLGTIKDPETGLSGYINAVMLTSQSAGLRFYLGNDFDPSIMQAQNYYFKTWARFAPRSGQVKGDLVAEGKRQILIDEQTKENTTYSENNTNLFDFSYVYKADYEPSTNSINLTYILNNNGPILLSYPNLDLHIGLDSNLVDLIDGVQIGNTVVPASSIVVDREGRQIIVQDIFANGVGRGAAEQSLEIKLFFKDGKNLTDAFSTEYRRFDFYVSIHNDDLNTLYEAAKSQIDSLAQGSESEFRTVETHLNRLLAEKQAASSTILTDANSNPDSVALPTLSGSTVEQFKQMLVFAAQYPTAESVAKVRELFDKTQSGNVFNRDTYIGTPTARAYWHGAVEAIEKLYAYYTSLIPVHGYVVVNTDSATFIDASDSDLDGLLDEAEQLYGMGTNPNNPDTDGDGVNDGDEVKAGTDPLVAPYNWELADGVTLKELSTATTTLSGKIDNRKYVVPLTSRDTGTVYVTDVQPRTINIVKIADNGDETIIATTQSDTSGAWSVSVEGLLQEGDNIRVDIVTNEVKGKLAGADSRDDEVVVQFAYPNAEKSTVMTVVKTPNVPTVDSLTTTPTIINYPVLTSTANTNHELDVALSTAIVIGLDTGDGEVEVTVTGIPDGLKYADGQITGTPTKLGTYS